MNAHMGVISGVHLSECTYGCHIGECTSVNAHVGVHMGSAPQ